MPPTDHQPLAPTRVERWGRRTAMAGFALFALIDVLIAYSGALTGPDAGKPVAWVEAGVLLLGAAIMVTTVFRQGDLWRRCLTGGVASLTLSIALIVAPGTGGGLVEEAGLFCLLLLGVRGLSPWRGRVSGVLLGVALLAQPLRMGNEGRAFSFLGALIAMAFLAAGFYLRGLDERRDRAVVDVRRAERLQLARELHDFVAHHVTGIVVAAQAAQVVAARDPQRALTSLSAIESAGLETLTSMRRLVGMMREDGDGAGILPGADGAALRELVTGFSRTGLPVELRTDTAIDRVPPDVAVSAHRIVLEALTNVRRHAVGASRVAVDVRGTAGGLLIMVRDDGTGHRIAPRGGPSGGFGLIGLSERADAVGGRLTAGPHAGGGWEVAALLPVTEAIA